MELRGHEHVVECAAFAPVAAYAPIRELVGLTVSGSIGTLVMMADLSLREATEQNNQEHLSLLGQETSRYGYGIPKQVNACVNS